MHEGHRKRMLARLQTAGSLHDHELIEILLFNAMPRKNMNGVAHDLLKTFGTINGIFQATFDQLLCVEGVGPEIAAYLQCISICNERIRFAETTFPERIDFQTFSRFLIERLQGLSTEVVEVYAVDSSDRIRSSKRFSTKESDRVAVDMDELASFLASHRPQGILIAHNHPQTTCKPSATDDDFTKEIFVLCSLLNVKLLDHSIVGRDGCYSYFRDARLDKMRSEYNIDTLLNRNKSK